MNFIGQKKIIDFIISKNIDTLPRTILLLGESGCGKKTIINMISEKIGLGVIDISTNCTLDTIMNIQQRPEPFIYTINLNKISIKEQNIILKFIEEPLKNAFIILTSTNENLILPTVFNRCFIIRFLPYTNEELSMFTDNNKILDIAKTPGQIQELLNCDIDGMLELSIKILTKIGIANIPNILTIADKLAFKGEKDKFDINAFSYIFISVIREYIIDNKDANIKFFDLYQLVQKWNYERLLPTVVQKSLFESYLIKMHELLGGQ